MDAEGLKAIAGRIRKINLAIKAGLILYVHDYINDPYTMDRINVLQVQKLDLRNGEVVVHCLDRNEEPQEMIVPLSERFHFSVI